MRGQQAIFADYLDDFPPVMSVSRKGRSEELHAKRNEALVERYYYYLIFGDKRYNIILDILQNEFHIASYTIHERISENRTILDELRGKKPELSYFKKKYPHLVW